MDAVQIPLRRLRTLSSRATGATGPAWWEQTRTKAGQAALDGLALATLFGLTLVFFWRIALTNLILVSYDLYAYFYPFKAYTSQALAEGRIPFWNPYLFMGAPFVANMQTAVFYPLNFPLNQFAPPQATSYSIIMHIFLAGAGGYLFARYSMGLGRFGGLAAGITFMFSGFMAGQVGHINQLNASAWLPLLFLCFDRACRKKSAGFAVAAGAIVGVQFLAGHSQEWYMTMLALGMYGVFQGLVGTWHALGLNGLTRKKLYGYFRRPWEPVLRLVREYVFLGIISGLVIALGAGISAIQLLPTFELSSLSYRSGGMPYFEATSFSLKPTMVLAALLPGFWQNPFSEYMAYVGVTALVLAVLAVLFARRNPHTVFFVLLSAFGLALSFGSNVPYYRLVYQYLPGVDLFRVPARWLYLYTFGAAMLAGIGAHLLSVPLKKAREAAGEAKRRGLLSLPNADRLLMSLALARVPLSLWLLAPRVDLPPMNTLGAWVIVAAAAVVLLLVGLPRVGDARFMGLIGLVLVVELFAASLNVDYNQATAPEAYSSLRTAVTFMLGQKSDGRILSVTKAGFEPGDNQEVRQMLGGSLSQRGVADFLASTKYKEVLAPNLPLTYGIPSIDGYDGGLLPLRRYAEFKKRLFAPEPVSTPQGILREQLTGLPPTYILNPLGVEYLLTDKTRDVWVDGAYYDLSNTVTVNPQGPRYAINVTSGTSSTALGIVSHLVGNDAAPQETPVAVVTLYDTQGRAFTSTLLAGRDTAEGDYERARQEWGVGHAQARAVIDWPNNPNARKYYAKVKFPQMVTPAQVEVKFLRGEGAMVVSGLTLLNDVYQSSEPLVLNPSYTLAHSGDVKIYHNESALPRAYFVAQGDYRADAAEVLDLLRNPTFENDRKVLLSEESHLPQGRLLAMDDGEGQEVFVSQLKAWKRDPEFVKSLQARPASAQAVPYSHIETLEPERIAATTYSNSDGFLVVTETFYPGWRAWVDGEEAPLWHANYLFKAVYVPAGKHSVELRYLPTDFKLGARITLVSLLVIIVGLLLRPLVWLVTPLARRVIVPWLRRAGWLPAPESGAEPAHTFPEQLRP